MASSLRIDGDDVAFNDLQGIARGGYEFDAVLNLVGGVADKLLDFLGRLRRTLRQAHALPARQPQNLCPPHPRGLPRPLH